MPKNYSSKKLRGKSYQYLNKCGGLRVHANNNKRHLSIFASNAGSIYATLFSCDIGERVHAAYVYEVKRGCRC